MVWAVFMTFRYPLFEKSSFSAALSRIVLAFGASEQ